MKPAPPEPSDLVLRLRQQLILAQVQILELEDLRDDAQTRVRELDRLLAALQGKADQALDDFDHLQGVHLELLKERDHLKHLLHLANLSLEETRAHVQHLSTELTAVTGREKDLCTHVTQLEQQAVELATQAAQLRAHGDELARHLTELQSVAAERLTRLNQLDAEIRTMKATRSWRWTAWLRSVERRFGRH